MYGALGVRHNKLMLSKFEESHATLARKIVPLRDSDNQLVNAVWKHLQARRWRVGREDANLHAPSAMARTIAPPGCSSISRRISGYCFMKECRSGVRNSTSAELMACSRTWPLMPSAYSLSSFSIW